MTAMAANLNRPEARATPAYALREATDGAFRDAMRQLASGVCVVTSGSGPDNIALTAASVSSLSSDPPTLLVCVNRTSLTYRVLKSCGAFAVNVLAADQREIADRFAGGSRLTRADRFRDGLCRVLPGGVAYLAGSVAVFDCEADERIEKHTHAIVIGRVKRVLVGDGSGALVRWRGAYDQVGWSRDEIARAIGLSPRAGGTD
jgi:flavin reductase (DIM6/NTAB) family NADH-FMN oxidoreductase RutF